MEEEIRILNKIIFEAVVHGGDFGGAYCINEDNLMNSIAEWIMHKNLSGKYKVKVVEVVEAGSRYPEMPQIVEVA